jgi:hypothetical protein
MISQVIQKAVRKYLLTKKKPALQAEETKLTVNGLKLNE